jgi:hypothetical protein
MEHRPYSRIEIERLVKDQSVSGTPPWSSGDDDELKAFFRPVLDGVQRQLALRGEVAWEQGSGYASYIEAWFYRATPEFRLPGPPSDANGYAGLQILLCRLAPVFVFMESDRTWTDQASSYSLACAESVDRFACPAVDNIASQVQALLESNGLTRLLRSDALQPIDQDLGPYTLLGDYPYKRFDALFHWTD